MNSVKDVIVIPVKTENGMVYYQLPKDYASVPFATMPKIIKFKNGNSSPQYNATIPTIDNDFDSKLVFK
jgi:hypothetical protein